MFDVLDCLLLFVYCIPVLEAPEADKIGKKIKKILMTNIRSPWH
jgi:hypothetical protein